MADRWWLGRLPDVGEDASHRESLCDKGGNTRNVRCLSNRRCHSSVAIATALSVNPPASDTSETARRYVSSIETYDLYLRGMDHMGRRGLGDMQTARASFRQATDADPGFARAYRSLAVAYARHSRRPPYETGDGVFRPEARGYSATVVPRSISMTENVENLILDHLRHIPPMRIIRRLPLTSPTSRSPVKSSTPAAWAPLTSVIELHGPEADPSATMRSLAI